MKTFRMIGMALFAVLMCVNFASCSSSDDDPTEEPEEGGVVVSGKKIAKIVGTSEESPYSETYTFSYDDKGRLIEAAEIEEEEGYDKDTETYTFTWGDDAIKVIEKGSGYTDSYTLTLRNGLIQNNENGDVFTYNSSNRLIKCTSNYKDETFSAIWDGDKLVSISEYNDEATLTYGTSCKKGYFPFFATMLTNDGDAALFMAHPEIAGMRSNQLPTSVTWTEQGYGGTGSSTSNLTYEFDKEGYISKLKSKDSDGSTWTYILTWE